MQSQSFTTFTNPHCYKSLCLATYPMPWYSHTMLSYVSAVIVCTAMELVFTAAMSQGRPAVLHLSLRVLPDVWWHHCLA